MKGTPGVLHGTRTLLLQDSHGQISGTTHKKIQSPPLRRYSLFVTIIGTHSISAGLDYPGVGPEHAWLKESGRAEYVGVDDKQALEGFKLLASHEGILPALEVSFSSSNELRSGKDC